MDLLRLAISKFVRSISRKALASPRDLETGDAETSEVVFRVEVLPCRSARALFCALYAAVAVCGLVLLSIALVNRGGRYDKNRNALLTVAGINLAVASFCVLVTSYCLISTSLRILTLRYGRIIWSDQRRRWMMFRMIEMCIQSMNSILYFTPNALVVITSGDVPARIIWLLEVLRLSTWSLVFFLFMLQARLLNVWVDKNSSPVLGEDSILLDAPWRKHWFLGFSWCAIHAVLAFCGWSQWRDAEGTFMDHHLELEHSYRHLRTSAGVFILSFIYHMGTFHFVHTGYRELAKKSYAMFRWVNIRLRYHQIQVFWTGGMISLSFLVMLLLQPGSTIVDALNILGVLPAHLALVSLAALNYYLLCPMKMEEGMSINVEPGRLSWPELSHKCHHATSPISWHPGRQHKPCFSFERMVKTWYWSLLAYRYENDDASIRFDLAKSMYGVTDHMVIRVKQHDITGIVAWGKNTIMIVFRGTSSFTNLRTDLHAWPVPHPPHRGQRWRGTCPLVHAGFLSSWETSGLKESILRKVKLIFASENYDLQQAKVILSGHSLGGALAILAALDIAKECKVEQHQLSCYTFGAPRVGNRAFKEEYDSKIPDTWQIANGHDVVPSIPKFLGFFSRVGERVIINTAGDMVVCPLFLEKSFSRPVHTVPTTFKDHLMRAYGDSLVSIVHAQYIKWKGLPGGIEAMNSLLAQGDSCTLVRALGIKLSNLKRLRSLSSRVWERNNLPLKSTNIFCGKISRNRDLTEVFQLAHPKHNKSIIIEHT